NIQPIANAGNDMNVSDADNNGSETVALNGNGSSDADDSIVSYLWSENNIVIATGEQTSASFGIGIHNIMLTVTDENGSTDTDIVIVTVTSPIIGTCPDDLVNGDTSIVLPGGTLVGGIDSTLGTSTETNNSPCAVIVGNVDSGQPWGRYRVSINLASYGIVAGDELLIGVDGKSLTGTGRLEINQNNTPNTALGFKTFGSSWSRYETTFVVPTGLSSIDLWFFSNY
ncbi:PKD domain-containing protein, partial [Maribacter aquivivus]